MQGAHAILIGVAAKLAVDAANLELRVKATSSFSPFQEGACCPCGTCPPPQLPLPLSSPEARSRETAHALRV